MMLIMRKIFFQKFFGLGLLILLISFVFYCNNPHGPGILNNEEEEEEEITYPFNGEADFTGDEVTVLTKCWEFTLFSITVEDSPLGESYPNGRFLIPRFKVKNLHGYLYLGEQDFTMIDRDGNIYFANTRGGTEETVPGILIGSEPLEKYEEFTGAVVFDVWDDYLDSGLVLKFESLATGTIIEFNILVDFSF